MTASAHLQRPGVPVPKGNPLARSIYGIGQIPVNFTQLFEDGKLGNRAFIPIAPWGAFRLHINIDQSATLRVQFAGRQRQELSQSAVAASTVLSQSGNAAAGNTVTLGSKTYTIVNAPVNNANDGEVERATTGGEGTLGNLFNALILGPGAGNRYSSATTAHPEVFAIASPNNQDIILTALSPGAAGNSLAFTTTWAALSSSAGATFAGGVTATLSQDETAIVADTPLLVDFSATEHVGEPWLELWLEDLAAAANVVFFEIAGNPIGS